MANHLKPNHPTGDREVMMRAVSVNGLGLRWASEELQRDREVALKAVTTTAEAVLFISQELVEDAEILHSVFSHSECQIVVVKVLSFRSGKTDAVQFKGFF